MTKHTLNLNDTVWVRLTAEGHAIYAERWRSLWPDLTAERSAPVEDEAGWSEWPLWALMAWFGSHISLKSPPPFEPEMRIKPLP